MVESISLKKIFDENKINKCNFLKLDCEGAEFKILESLPNEYFNKINKIVLANSPLHGACFKFLGSH